MGSLIYALMMLPLALAQTPDVITELIATHEGERYWHGGAVGYNNVVSDQFIAWLMARRQATVEQLVAVLDHPDPAVRYAAFAALRDRKEREALRPLLVRLMSNDDPLTTCRGGCVCYSGSVASDALTWFDDDPRGGVSDEVLAEVWRRVASGEASRELRSVVTHRWPTPAELKSTVRMQAFVDRMAGRPRWAPDLVDEAMAAGEDAVALLVQRALAKRRTRDRRAAVAIVARAMDGVEPPALPELRLQLWALGVTPPAGSHDAMRATKPEEFRRLERREARRTRR